MNQMEHHLVQNRKENYHHDHIPFNLKGNENIFFGVETGDTSVGLSYIKAFMYEIFY